MTSARSTTGLPMPTPTGLRPDSEMDSDSSPTNERTNELTKKYSPRDQSFDLGDAHASTTTNPQQWTAKCRAEIRAARDRRLLADRDRDAINDAINAERGGRSLPKESTTHECPPDGSGLTPCCGRTPFELPGTDRMTVDVALVTCFDEARFAADQSRVGAELPGPATRERRSPVSRAGGAR